MFENFVKLLLQMGNSVLFLETNMILDFAIVVSQSQSLHRLDQSTVCVFSSSEFFTSFLIVETSFILHLLLSFECELLHLNFVELVFFSAEASSSVRNAAFNCVED